MGVFYDGRIRLGPFTGIKDAWKNEPCFIIGCSKALDGIDLEKLRGFHTIGINHIIEDFDGLEWLIFLDNRFLQKTKYNIEKFTGRIFASNKTVLFGDRITRFRVKSASEPINTDIETGLWNGNLTGLCAVNLALISGATPIYLLGMDNKPEYNYTQYHYKPDYTGEVKDPKKYKKYLGANQFNEAFKPFAENRIYNVCKGGLIKAYKQIDFNEIPLDGYQKPEPKIYDMKKELRICHIINMENMDVMGDISRQVFTQSTGKHIFSNINKTTHPDADIYLLECFINGADKFIHFQKPRGSKVISLIHSSSTCLPALCSDKIITLTDAWQKILLKKGFKTEVIPAGIDTGIYDREINYKLKTFGRITRNSPGKIHPRFIDAAKSALNAHPDAKMIFYTDNTRATPPLIHERAQYITNIKIHEHEKKAEALGKLTIFADAHNTFQETFSLCLLEAMAAGLCIILHAPNNPAMIEVLGGTGITVENMTDFQNELINTLPDTEKKREYGQKARERAKLYTIEKMIEKYNRIFQDVMK